MMTPKDKPDRSPITRFLAAAWPLLLALLLVIIGWVVFASCSALAPDEPAEGGGPAAADFEIEVFGNENYEKGEVVRLSQFAGQPVLINFWYPSCPPCRLEMPDLEATWRKHREDGLQLIGIQSLSLDTIEEGQDFVDEFGITYAIGPDTESEILIDYNAVSWPTSVFLNKDHEIVRTWAGVLTEEKLDEIVTPLLR